MKEVQFEEVEGLFYYLSARILTLILELYSLQFNIHVSRLDCFLLSAKHRLFCFI